MTVNISKKKKMAWLSGVVIFFSIFPACQKIDNVEYSVFYDFGCNGWNPAECLEFSPFPADSMDVGSVRYDLVLCVRYSGKCKLNRLPISMEQVSLSQKPDTMHMEIALTTPDGSRRGKGPYTIYEVTDTVAWNILIPEGYTVTLFNPLEAESTSGVTNIGLILSRH